MSLQESVFIKGKKEREIYLLADDKFYLYVAPIKESLSLEEIQSKSEKELISLIENSGYSMSYNMSSKRNESDYEKVDFIIQGLVLRLCD